MVCLGMHHLHQHQVVKARPAYARRADAARAHFFVQMPEAFFRDPFAFQPFAAVILAVVHVYARGQTAHRRPVFLRNRALKGFQDRLAIGLLAQHMPHQLPAANVVPGR